MPAVLDYSLGLVTAPANLPVTLIEAKKQCEVASTDTVHDAQLMSLIAAATSLVERDSQRKLVCQVWEQRLNEWPGTEYLPLRFGPVLSVPTVKYIDDDGVEQTWAAANYTVDTARTRPAIWLAYGIDWPSSSTRNIQDAIRIRGVCGYGDPFTAAAATDLITPTYGGYALGDMVQLSNYGGALPAGLSSRTTYYVVTAGATIQLAIGNIQTPVDITGAGTGTHYIDCPPPEAKQAILMLVGHWFENRETVVTGTISSELQMSYRCLVGAITAGYYP